MRINEIKKTAPTGGTVEGGNQQNASANLSETSLHHSERNINNQLLRADDVSAILNVSRTQAYRLMRDEIPVVRFGGGTVRVRATDLEEYISGHVQRGGEWNTLD